jgi:signal transduction histidine kinase
MDFCPKKDGKINIKLHLEDNAHARISIIDNGVGIPKSKLDKIFIKFYQIDTSTTREHGGTGLGLVVCKGIIESHGGKIWAESEETNKGTQIHIHYLF